MGQGDNRVRKEDSMTGIKVRVMGFLVLKTEEGAMSQGMEEDHRSRKRHENVQSCTGMQPYWHLKSSSILHGTSDLQSCKIINLVYVKPLKIVVTCYNRIKKLIQNLLQNQKRSGLKPCLCYVILSKIPNLYKPLASSSAKVNL